MSGVPKAHFVYSVAFLLPGREEMVEKSLTEGRFFHHYLNQARVRSFLEK